MIQEKIGTIRPDWVAEMLQYSLNFLILSLFLSFFPVCASYTISHHLKKFAVK